MIDDDDQKAFFKDSGKILELKRNIVRFAIEEQMRRVQKHPEKINQNILQVLFPDNKKDFVDVVWNRRKKEIEMLYKDDNKD